MVSAVQFLRVFVQLHGAKRIRIADGNRGKSRVLDVQQLSGHQVVHQDTGSAFAVATIQPNGANRSDHFGRRD